MAEKKTDQPKSYRFKLLRGGHTSGSRHKGNKMDYQPEGNRRGLPHIIENPTNADGDPVNLAERFGKDKFQLLEPGET